MEYEKISLSLSHFQVQEAIKQLVRQDFPDHSVVNISIRADGGANVEVKNRKPRYSQRD